MAADDCGKVWAYTLKNMGGFIPLNLIFRFIRGASHVSMWGTRIKKIGSIYRYCVNMKFKIEGLGLKYS